MGGYSGLGVSFGARKSSVLIYLLHHQSQPKAPGLLMPLKSRSIGFQLCWLTLDKSQSRFKISIKVSIFLRNLHHDLGKDNNEKTDLELKIILNPFSDKNKI